MFVSLNLQKALGFNDAIKAYEYQFDLVDTDFRETVFGPSLASHIGKATLIFEVYDRKKLDVALNVVLYLLYVRASYGYDVKQSAIWLQNYAPHWYRAYKKEIGEYLNLL